MELTELVEAIESAFIKSRKGDIRIDTPHTASYIHEFIIENFELDFNAVRLYEVDFGFMKFSVRSTVFKFSFKPNFDFKMFYRHMESDKWIDADFQKTESDLGQLTKLIKKHAITSPPSPIDN